MVSDANDLIIRAAWYYYVEDMTQAEIGERLSVTRRRVNEMLAQARESGLVTVNFNSPLKDCAELEAKLCQTYGLQAAAVVPTPTDPDLIHRVLGRATAQFFERLLQARRPKSIAVGWGSTLRETIQMVQPQKLDGLDVYSIMGGLTRGTEINTFETVRSFAEVLGGTSNYLVAPIYLESASARDALVSQESFRKSLEAVCAADIALVSVGDVTSQSLQVRYGLPEGTTAADLRQAGAIGDLIGRYLGADGNEIDHPLNRQVLAPALAEFRAVPLRIVTSGGSHKHAIMKAVVHAGHVNAVVTDSACAEALIRGAAGR